MDTQEAAPQEITPTSDMPPTSSTQPTPEVNQPRVDGTPSPTQANNSGNAPTPAGTSSLNGPFPAELNHWNWGAFLLNWIWGIGHSVWIALIILAVGWIPFLGGIISLGMMIALGIKGNEWAWQHRKFESVEQFKAVERVWTRVAVILFLLEIIAIPIIILTVYSSLGGASLRARDARRTFDARAILKAVTLYKQDHGLPEDITSATTPRCIGEQLPCVNLEQELVPQYISAIPKDPGLSLNSQITPADTGYTIQYNPATQQVTIGAPNSEGGQSISVSE